MACSRARLEELKPQEGFARAVRLEAALHTANEARSRFPLMKARGVLGALYLPTDGSARAPILARALAEAARGRGVELRAHARVTGFEVAGGRVRAVVTTRGGAPAPGGGGGRPG